MASSNSVPSWDRRSFPDLGVSAFVLGVRLEIANQIPSQFPSSSPPPDPITDDHIELHSAVDGKGWSLRACDVVYCMFILSLEKTGPRSWKRIITYIWCH